MAFPCKAMYVTTANQFLFVNMDAETQFSDCVNATAALHAPYHGA
jgi:hypothetical protein